MRAFQSSLLHHYYLYHLRLYHHQKQRGECSLIQAQSLYELMKTILKKRVLAQNTPSKIKQKINRVQKKGERILAHAP